MEKNNTVTFIKLDEKGLLVTNIISSTYFITFKEKFPVAFVTSLRSQNGFPGEQQQWRRLSTEVENSLKQAEKRDGSLKIPWRRIEKLSRHRFK